MLLLENSMKAFWIAIIVAFQLKQEFWKKVVGQAQPL